MKLDEEDRELLLDLLDTMLRRPKPKPKDYPAWRDRARASDLFVRLRIEPS